MKLMASKLLPDALSVKLYQALADQDISIREAARRSGISLGRFADILYGRTRRPTPDTLQGIAVGLNLSYRELALAAYGVITDVPPAESVSA